MGETDLRACGAPPPWEIVQLGHAHSLENDVLVINRLYVRGIPTPPPPSPEAGKNMLWGGGGDAPTRLTPLINDRCYLCHTHLPLPASRRK